IPVYNGNVDLGTERIHGVGIQATSSENVFRLTAAGSTGGLLAIAGSLPLEIISSATKAHVDDNAQVNQDTTNTGDLQDVNISAANTVKTFGVAVNLGVGIASISGGIDLGIIRNDINAYTGPDAIVSARNDIDLHTMWVERVNSLVGGFGAHFAGLEG